MKKVVVVGGSGFIGSHVADHLSEVGYEVTIYDKNSSRWIRPDQKMIVGDVLETEKLNQCIADTGADVVYNFAALSDLNKAMHEPLSCAKINILGTVQALNLCRKYKIKRFIQASSIYATSSQGSFYSCSKRAAEDYLVEFHKSHKLNYTILRFGSVYGFRSDKNNGIKKILDKAISQRKIIYSGNKKAVRKYINVLDAAKGCVEILKSRYENKCIILTGHKSFKINEVLKFLANTLNIDSKIIFKNEKNSQHYIKKLNPYLMKRGKKFKFTKMIDFKKGINFLIKELKH